MSNIKHICIFIFVFSVFSLTLQASLINFCKESRVFKSQNQSNPTTEEEKGHDADEETDEVFYLENNLNIFVKCLSINKFWSKQDFDCLSFTKSIPIPPPKF